MNTTGAILLIEDDHVDTMTVRRVFEELKIDNPLVSVTNGEEALQYLQDAENPPPVLILLDLNMPRMNGLEFLRIVKADETLKAIPVVILTTSNQNSDISNGYRLGAAGYIVKSVDYHEFVETMNVMYHYWSICRLPNLQLCTE